MNIDMSLWAPSGWQPGAEITSLVGYIVTADDEAVEVPLAATGVNDPAMPAALAAAGYKMVGVPDEPTPSPLSYCQGWVTVQVANLQSSLDIPSGVE